MVKVEMASGEKITVADPLVQWDYGQQIRVEGLTNVSRAEVHFASRARKYAIPVDAALEGEVLETKIPDELLQTGEEIRAHIYAVGENSGKTVYTIVIPVKKREKPEDYTEPEHYDRLEEIARKLDEKGDNISYKDGYLQLLSGEVPIGSRIRLQGQGGGREIELKNDGTAISWRYTDSNEWTELVKLNDLKGKDGETPEFEIREGHLFAIYKE